MYPAEIVIPMKEELTENGFSELLTPQDVDMQLQKDGTTLVMINSVCGCSSWFCASWRIDGSSQFIQET